MLTPTPPVYRFRRSRSRRRAAGEGPPPPAAAPVLVLATVVSYEPFVLRLGFDRAIDVSGLVPGQVQVEDPSGTGFKYAADAVQDVPDAQTVELSMEIIGSAEGTMDVLNAGAGNGIVAAEGGAAWGGVTGVALPFSG